MDFELLSRRNFLKVSTVLTVGAITPSVLGNLVNPGPSIPGPSPFCRFKKGEPYTYRMGDGFDANGQQIWEEFEVTTCEPEDCLVGSGQCGKMPKFGQNGKLLRNGNQLRLFTVNIDCDAPLDPQFPVLPICMVGT